MMFLLMSSGQLMKNLAISSLKNQMRPILVSSSSVKEDSQLKSEPSLSSDSNFCLEEPISCFVFKFLFLTCYSIVISILNIIKGINFNWTYHRCSKPANTLVQLSFLNLPQKNHSKQQLSAVKTALLSSKIVKLRPKSQFDMPKDLSFNHPKANNLQTTDQKKNSQKYHSKSFHQGNVYQQKFTKKTSLQESFKEEPSFDKDRCFSDLNFLTVDLKEVDNKQQNGVAKRREVIKLKRFQKLYSPINKLIQLQTMRAKKKINVFSKELINIQ